MTDFDRRLPILKVEEICRKFPGVLALNQVHFDVLPGEVHVLFGENGAGKSTLISILAGVYKPTSGTIYFKQKPIVLDSVHVARENGISAVFQEFSLVDNLTVYQNIFLGGEKTKSFIVSNSTMKKEATKLLDQLGFDINPDQKVTYLSRAEQQMVEIAKAFRKDPSVLILDEPTASLSESEALSLFDLIKKLRRQGVAIIYITHRMKEIELLADRITVLRDGKYIKTLLAKNANEASLIELMSGKKISQIYPKIDPKKGSEILRINGLQTKDQRVKQTSITVNRGEIVGIAGLVGCGKSKLMRACFGLEKLKAGSIVFNNKEVSNPSPKKMLDLGFFYLPSNRQTEGLVFNRSCKENITLPSLRLKKFLNWLFIKSKYEKKLSIGLAKKLNLQPLKIERSVDHFSGGNQQKVMLAKCLTREVELFVFDEPTVGVDVRTRVEIYKFIAKLTKQNAAVVIVSSDLHEVINLSQRLYVMNRGVMQKELIGADITEEKVLESFFITDNQNNNTNHNII